jgi:hypothetical protein
MFGGRSVSIKIPVLILGFQLLLGGCGQTAKTATVDRMVGEIVKRATTDEAAFFTEYLDTSYKGQKKQLIQQIKASGMADNYQSRLEGVSETKAHLNYHFLEKGCHFQIDLVKQDDAWTIKRIWFCR